MYDGSTIDEGCSDAKVLELMSISCLVIQETSCCLSAHQLVLGMYYGDDLGLGGEDSSC